MFLYPLLFDLNYSSPSNINIELRFNLCSKTADNDPFFIDFTENIFDMLILKFLEDQLWIFLLSSANSPNILNDQRQSWFLFQTMKVSLFCIFEKHYYILIIVRIVRKCFSIYLFLLGYALFFLLLCIIDIHIRTGFTWRTVVSFEIWKSDSKLSLCSISYSVMFPLSKINKVLSVIFRVFHCWK